MHSRSLQTFALVLGFASMSCGGEVEPSESLGSPAETDDDAPTATATGSGAPTTSTPAASMSTNGEPSGSNPVANPPATPPPVPEPVTSPVAVPVDAPAGGAPPVGDPAGGSGGTASGGTSSTPPDFPTPTFPPFDPPNGAGGADTPVAMGGSSLGGSSPMGGSGPTMGGASSGGVSSGGSAGSPPVVLDCNAPMPSGGEQHSGNGVGGEGNLSWEIWSNTGEGELTTFSVPAFVASWNEAGGYLGRLGFEWGAFGETPGPYETHGTITAQFVANKSGTAGQYSYVGMYGWSTDPCVEWYVVEDSYNNMPINPGNTTNKGEVDIDDGTYIMYTRDTTGTGGSRCSDTTQWIQYYSVRKTARACGQISLTQHFDAWKDLGMPLGNLLEAKILVEVGGGSGRVELPVANVITTE